METLMADEPRLSERAEQLLASFPVPEIDWEAQARAVEARLSTTALGSTEERWLEAPLAEEAPEIGAPAASNPLAELALGPTETPFPFESMPSIIEAPPSTREPARAPAAAGADPSAAPEPPGTAAAAATATPVPSSGNSRSLSALARSVAQKGGRPQSRDIALESLSVAAAARSQNDAMAERVRSARPVPPPPSQRPLPPSQRTRGAPVAPTPANNNAQLGPWIAVGGIGIAAAIALWAMRPAAPAAPQASLEQSAAQAHPVAQAPEPTSIPKRSAPEAVAEGTLARAAPTDAVTPSVAASALPLAPRLAAAAAAPVRAGSEAPTTKGGAAAPASERPTPESIVLEDTPTSAKGGANPGSAPLAATSGLRPAAGSPSGGLPDRPSTGAVQAAVGSVMSAARACVAGGVATPAQVTFGSNGAVQTVAVSGPNAGTPSASCIDAALRRARVAPFASPTFSLMVWVRP